MGRPGVVGHETFVLEAGIETHLGRRGKRTEQLFRPRARRTDSATEVRDRCRVGAFELTDLLGVEAPVVSKAPEDQGRPIAPYLEIPAAPAGESVENRLVAVAGDYRQSRRRAKRTGIDELQRVSGAAIDFPANADSRRVHADGKPERDPRDPRIRTRGTDEDHAASSEIRLRCLGRLEERERTLTAGFEAPRRSPQLLSHARARSPENDKEIRRPSMGPEKSRPRRRFFQ
jgi:hypothetical protein